MSDELVIVGGDSGDVPGSREFVCAVCAKRIWLSPSGQKVQSTGVRVLCLSCGMEEAERYQDVECAVLPEALTELKAYLKKKVV